LVFYESIDVITVSVVSHGHGGMVQNLLEDLRSCPEVSRIIVTRNIPEPTVFAAVDGVEIIENVYPKGFAANHNAAFTRCETEYYCVLNPDIRLPENPFPRLLDALRTRRAALAAPLIVAPDGNIEDSIRHFPTISRLTTKALGFADGRYEVAAGDPPLFPDWVAGMFLLFRAEDFAAIKGFDDRFFLYYEDVDICARLWRSGRRIVACPATRAIHDAQRASRRNLRHMRWHLRSMARYFAKHLGRLPVVPIGSA